MYPSRYLFWGYVFMNKLLFCLLSYLLLLSPLALSDSYTIQKNEQNKVEWTAIGSPGFLKINATGGHLEGKIETKNGLASGKLRVKLENFDTGMNLRNKHMNEKYLEIGKFPYMTLVLKDVKYKEGDFKFTGMLTIKDETKPVSGSASFVKGLLKADFKVKVEQYPNIGNPSFMGVTMADEVEVHVETKL